MDLFTTAAAVYVFMHLSMGKKEKRLNEKDGGNYSCTREEVIKELSD